MLFITKSFKSFQHQINIAYTMYVYMLLGTILHALYGKKGNNILKLI
jgi:hypothetical protein